MPKAKIGRREFLTDISVAAAMPVLTSVAAVTQTSAPQPSAHTPAPPHSPGAPGYIYLKPVEQVSVEALVDHMIPKDEFTGSGTEIGIATFIDRALAGSWGKGDRFYNSGPWQRGTANQGYQLPLTPAELFRVGILGSNGYCRKTFGKDFQRCADEQKETFLKDLAAGRITFDGDVPGQEFFAILYQTVMEGLFADPIYGGNKDKVSWKMIGFPGVIANNAEHVKHYSDGKRFTTDPVSIADLS